MNQGKKTSQIKEEISNKFHINYASIQIKYIHTHGLSSEYKLG